MPNALFISGKLYLKALDEEASMKAPLKGGIATDSTDNPYAS